MLKTIPRTLFQAACFVFAFAVLQGFWGVARGSAVEQVVIGTLTVEPAAGLINLLTPEARAVAHGTRLAAPGGGINVRYGCEGTEVLFLLLAALLACPLSWRARLGGALCGGCLVFALNQVRLLALFYAYRAEPALFDRLHGTVAPIVLVAATALFFLYWTGGRGPDRADHGPPAA